MFNRNRLDEQLCSLGNKYTHKIMTRESMLHDRAMDNAGVIDVNFVVVGEKMLPCGTVCEGNSIVGGGPMPMPKNGHEITNKEVAEILAERCRSCSGCVCPHGLGVPLCPHGDKECSEVTALDWIAVADKEIVMRGVMRCINDKCPKFGEYVGDWDG